MMTHICKPILGRLKQEGQGLNSALVIGYTMFVARLSYKRPCFKSLKSKHTDIMNH